MSILYCIRQHENIAKTVETKAGEEKIRKKPCFKERKTFHKKRLTVCVGLRVSFVDGQTSKPHISFAAF